MSRYIPMPAFTDSMPVDISFVFEDEKPAGKHGFVRADGEDLRFEDGTLAKFWGVNFNGGAAFPDKEYAKKVSRRLAMAGVNLVRFHQLDAQWQNPNLFAFTKGKRQTSTQVFDPQSMDALDYLIYCLKEEGIYCYMDNLTHRRFKEDDGVPFYEQLVETARPWCQINPRLIQLQKEHCTRLWSHVNPYTGLAYKDDPVFVLTEIINETDMYINAPGKLPDFKRIPYYENEFRGFFRDWLEQEGLTYDWENCDLYVNEEPMLRFKYYITKKYVDEMREHLISIGVKIPIAGTNWVHNHYVTKSHENMDFCDGHHYTYDFRWGTNEKLCANRCIAASPCNAQMGTARLPNKPFFISEWDVPWPNTYRAEGPIWYAAMGALQNWSGFAVHTYAYSTKLDKIDVLGRDMSVPPGGTPYREGIFSVWNDPARFGLFYHSALILRRSDVRPAEKKVVLKVTDYTKTDGTASKTGLEQHQMAVVYDDQIPEGYDELVMEEDVIPYEQPHLVVSDTRQLYRDMERQIGVVDTPRTKVAYGQIGKRTPVYAEVNGKKAKIGMDGMWIDSKTDFGVVALSSLTDSPIASSDNMLLSAIGRARNTGAQFDGDKMLELGHAPILAEVIEADVHIKTDIGDKLKVWGVNAEGYYGACLLTTYENGILSFHIGDENNPACYYLIFKD